MIFRNNYLITLLLLYIFFLYDYVHKKQKVKKTHTTEP